MYRIIRYLLTIIHLKPIQVYFRIFYSIKKRIIPKYYNITNTSVTGKSEYKITFLESIASIESYDLNNQAFTFLNSTVYFNNSIQWNYIEEGKLWNYNLHYFDYLNQNTLPNSVIFHLLITYIQNINIIKYGTEPYPTSLRIINWIKAICKHQIKNNIIDESLYKQLFFLSNNIEYHLLGNHLLENAFALLFGSYYFRNDKLYDKAKKLLLKQLDQQLLQDGAHFELSPMYHCIIIFRLLDSINIVKHNTWKKHELLPFLTEKASIMLNYINNMSYDDGTVAHLNDSTIGIAPSIRKLLEYAESLQVRQKTGIAIITYPKRVEAEYECIVDVNEIGPDYIPGHAHADTFTFELRLRGRPFIVDTGISTYEISKRRDYERSTSAHNTVEIGGINSSDVWGSFRVGRRARIINRIINENTIKATHDGYSGMGVFHTREWEFERNRVKIIDELNVKIEAIARLHFHPMVTEEMINTHIRITNGKYSLGTYYFANGYNRLDKAYMLEIHFNKVLCTEVLCENTIYN